MNKLSNKILSPFESIHTKQTSLVDLYSYKLFLLNDGNFRLCLQFLKFILDKKMAVFRKPNQPDVRASNVVAQLTNTS